mgnify:CR=1 FL=1
MIAKAKGRPKNRTKCKEEEKLVFIFSLFFKVLRKQFQVMSNQKGEGQLKEGIIPILLNKGKSHQKKEKALQYLQEV